MSFEVPLFVLAFHARAEAAENLVRDRPNPRRHFPGIDGLLRLARSDERMPVNLGNPEEFTVLECASLVLYLTGSRSNIRHLPLSEDDPRQRRPDITKARALLGWEPKVELTVGLRLALEYFRSALALPADSAAPSPLRAA